MVTSNPGESVHLGLIDFDPNMEITMLGTEGNLEFSEASPGTLIQMPDERKITSKWVYTLVFTNSS